MLGEKEEENKLEEEIQFVRRLKMRFGFGRETGKGKSDGNRGIECIDSK